MSNNTEKKLNVQMSYEEILQKSNELMADDWVNSDHYNDKLELIDSGFIIKDKKVHYTLRVKKFIYKIDDKMIKVAKKLAGFEKIVKEKKYTTDFRKKIEKCNRIKDFYYVYYVTDGNNFYIAHTGDNVIRAIKNTMIDKILRLKNNMSNFKLKNLTITLIAYVYGGIDEEVKKFICDCYVKQSNNNINIIEESNNNINIIEESNDDVTENSNLKKKDIIKDHNNDIVSDICMDSSDDMYTDSDINSDLSKNTNDSKKKSKKKLLTNESTCINIKEKELTLVENLSINDDIPTHNNNKQIKNNYKQIQNDNKLIHNDNKLIRNDNEQMQKIYHTVKTNKTKKTNTKVKKIPIVDDSFSENGSLQKQPLIDSKHYDSKSTINVSLKHNNKNGCNTDHNTDHNIVDKIMYSNHDTDDYCMNSDHYDDNVTNNSDHCEDDNSIKRNKYVDNRINNSDHSEDGNSIKRKKNVDNLTMKQDLIINKPSNCVFKAEHDTIMHQRIKNKSKPLKYINETKHLCAQLFINMGTTFDHVCKHGFILYEKHITNDMISLFLGMKDDCKKYLPFINLNNVQNVWMSLIKHILKANGFYWCLNNMKIDDHFIKCYIIDKKSKL